MALTRATVPTRQHLATKLTIWFGMSLRGYIIQKKPSTHTNHTTQRTIIITRRRRTFSVMELASMLKLIFCQLNDGTTIYDRNLSTNQLTIRNLKMFEQKIIPSLYCCLYILYILTSLPLYFIYRSFICLTITYLAEIKTIQYELKSAFFIINKGI